jgi:predicted amidohydrolase
MTKVAIVQVAPQFMNLEASLSRAIEFIGEAANMGAKLVVLKRNYWTGRQYVVDPVFDEERIIVAELNFEAIDKERMTLDVTGHYHRTDLFELRVK